MVHKYFYTSLQYYDKNTWTFPNAHQCKIYYIRFRSIQKAAIKNEDYKKKMRTTIQKLKDMFIKGINKINHGIKQHVQCTTT